MILVPHLMEVSTVKTKSEIRQTMKKADQTHDLNVEKSQNIYQVVDSCMDYIGTLAHLLEDILSEGVSND